MKNSLRPFVALLLAGLGLATASHAQSVGIGAPDPNASAALEVRSTTQGLLVFQTDGSQGLYYYSGIAWLNLANGRVPDANGSTSPANGGVVSTLAASTSSSNPSLASPAGVAIGTDGSLYVASLGADVIFSG